MIKNSCDGATSAHGDDAALSAQRAATSASSTRRFRFPFSPSQNCGYVLTNRYSRLFAISIEDLLVGIRIKLQYTPEKRRYSNFDLLVTLRVILTNTIDSIINVFLKVMPHIKVVLSCIPFVHGASRRRRFFIPNFVRA